MRFTFAILPVTVLGSAADPCARLCVVDGPLICTDGSYNKNGVCHGYLFRGDPSVNDYCYHTSATASTCPSSGKAVKVADAHRLVVFSEITVGQAVGTSVGPVWLGGKVSGSTFHVSDEITTTVNPSLDELPPFEPVTMLPQTATIPKNPVSRSLAERLRALRAKATERYSKSQRIPMRRVNIERDTALIESLPFLNGPIQSLVQEHMHVSFIGEKGYGLGQTKEWIAQLTRQMFSIESGYFVLSDEAHPAYKINPSGLTRPQARDVYRATGRLLALSLIRNHPLGIDLPVMLYAKLLDQELTVDDVDDEDRPLMEYLDYLGSLLNLSSYELVYHPIRIDGENVIPTIQNREELVQQKVNSLIAPDVLDVLEIIRQGFKEMIPIDTARTILTAGEIKSAILGSADIDIEDFFANSSFALSLAQREMFHRILTSFTKVQRREFLGFVTNQKQLPIGGFSQIKPQIAIFGGQTDFQDQLPRVFSSTHTLALPDYASESQMREKLLLAINRSRFTFL